MTTGDTRVLHARWSGGRLHLWAESGSAWAGIEPGVLSPADPAAHPFACGGAEAAEFVGTLTGVPAEGVATLRQRLPVGPRGAASSAALSRLLSEETPGNGEAPVFGEFDVGTAVFAPSRAGEVLERLADPDLRPEGAAMDPSVEFFAVTARMSRHLVVQQRFVPLLCQDGAGALTGVWQPWLADERTAERVGVLLRSMPAAARATVDAFGHDPWRIVEDCLSCLVNAECRRVLELESMIDTVEDRDPAADPQVAWLQGLLSSRDAVPAPLQQRTDIVRRVRRWIGTLEERGESSAWRLALRLLEPDPDGLADDVNDTAGELTWRVVFALQSQQDPEVMIDASEVWLLPRDSVTLQGFTLDAPQELLLAELGRASRLYKRLEGALDESEPAELRLSTREAYEFLREHRPILIEQGFGVEAPAWWESPAGRLGARLRINSDPLAALAEGASGTSAARAQLGLTALVGYHWEIAIGDTTLTLHEFESFAGKSSPLVRIGGKWVEIRPEDVQAAIRFIRENPGGQMELAEAMRLAYATDPKQTGVRVLGMEATGWVADLLGGGEGGAIELPMLQTPESFRGTLRPYQARGLSWMAFMERFGFGACLADDMGLGKTVQLLALLVHEREAAGAEAVPPTLLVVPMSVVGNWMHEVRRFTPQIRLMVHHGVERLQGEDFVDRAERSDLVVTTYALAHRDRELLERVPWRRMVLDEAQFVKNPAAKQAQAVRAIGAERRIALTGTPVENRLSELWSIMDFLNPGYLGHGQAFRKRFAVPIERYRDQARSEQLRGLVRPFVLRRVKTDPSVVADLPEKLESREYCHLTSEQAALYESCVKRMLSEVEQSEGIHRRGLVLAALIRLKQICNHPSQLLKDHDPASGKPVDPTRSGKCIRVLEMLDEVLAEGDQALVFTQFRQMGHLLSAMLRHELERDVLFLHGGTPQGQRQKMIEQFQAADGTKPILILSLKAGGVGLNLTAATHVFHFDRWWNPAVENQATDRAYRIGQTRTVQVHKFVVRGTLEERVDEMIEAKTELAENIIGAGERWLTELDTDQLRDILTLRSDAVDSDE